MNTYLFDDHVKHIRFVNGKGIYLYDEYKNKYIDAEAGTFNLSLGYQNEQVIDAAKRQMDKLIHLSSSFENEPINELAKNLIKCAPSNISRVYTKVTGGSTANEGAIKLAQFYTKRSPIISFYRSHYGQTVFLQTLSGLSVRKRDFRFVQSDICHVNYPYCYRCPYGHTPDTCSLQCLEEINDKINYSLTEIPSCIIIEPILGNGGNQIPPTKYILGLKKISEENDITLIFDEIQTGIGRTGYMFASEYFKVQPNIITIAKGLGGTGFQAAAILMEDKYNKMESWKHSFTYGSNLVSLAAANETVKIINNAGFLNNVRICGDWMKSELEKLKESYTFIGDVRGVGLMLGIEIVKDKKSKIPDVSLTKYIQEKALENRLLLRSSLYGFGNVIKIRPSLNISQSECVEILERLKKTLRSL